MFESVSIYKDFFLRSRARNSKVTDPIRLEFELVQDFMPVLVTSKFDEDLIKNECASLETPFSHYKFMGNVLDAQGHLTPKGVVPSGRNSNSSQTLCLSSLSASLMKIGSKLKALAWRHRIPHYKSMGAFCCHGNHSFDGICSKSSLSPVQLMIHIKFYQDWPTVLLILEIT